VHTVGAL